MQIGDTIKAKSSDKKTHTGKLIDIAKQKDGSRLYALDVKGQTIFFTESQIQDSSQKSKVEDE